MPVTVHSVDAARHASAIQAVEKGARIIGGGTLILHHVNAGDIAIDMLVCLDKLGLDQIQVLKTRVKLGAMVTMADIIAHPDLGFLAPVARGIGGPAIRAMATIGGNLFAPSPYGDMSVALLALDASITLETLDEKLTLPIEDFLKRRKKLQGAVVTEISFARPAAGTFLYAKVIRRKPVSAAVLSIAALLPRRGKLVAKPRIAYGAMAPTAIRAKAVEAAIDGKALDAATIAAATKVAAKGCTPQTDAYASDWYRSEILPVHLARLLGAEAKTAR